MSDGTGEYGQGEAALTKAAGMVAEAKTDFDTLSTQLTDQLSGVQSKWGGSGATAFFQLQTAWTEKQRTIVNALNDFESSLKSTEQDNISTDESQSAVFNSAASRLGGL